MVEISRRNVLAMMTWVTALGIGAGTASARPRPSVQEITVDAANLRGYWASNRNDNDRRGR